MLPNLSHLSHADTFVDMAPKRTLPWLKFTPPTQRARASDEPDGWEMPSDWLEPKKEEFRAAMGNLSNFSSSIEFTVSLDENDMVDPETINMDWDDTTEIQKRAFGRALDLFHNDRPDAVMIRVGKTRVYPTVEYRALLYAPEQWQQVFDQREPWNIEVEANGNQRVLRLSKD